MPLIDRNSPPRVEVGVGVIMIRDGRVILGQRMGSHGAGTWALPGGHLEFGESVNDCARRETQEETGLRLKEIIQGPYTNDVMAAEGKHDVTVFVQAAPEEGEPEVLEPDKCECRAWFMWSELPPNLFLPMANLVGQGFVPAEAVA